MLYVEKPRYKLFAVCNASLSRRELVCASDVLLLAPTASVYLHKLMLADIDMPHLAHAPLYAISQALMPNTEASASSSSNSSSSSSTDMLVRLQAQCRLRLIDRYGLVSARR
jgi:hypothetical protein